MHELTEHQQQVLGYILRNPGCSLDASQKNAAQPLIRAGCIRREIVNYRSTYYVTYG